MNDTWHINTESGSQGSVVGQRAGGSRYKGQPVRQCVDQRTRAHAYCEIQGCEKGFVDMYIIICKSQGYEREDCAHVYSKIYCNGCERIVYIHIVNNST